MTEAQEQQQVITWLKHQHPTVLFRIDYSAGMKLTMGQAMRMKKAQSRRGWPDLFIAEPRGGYHGLFIEFKKTGASPYKKNGEFKSGDHIKEQRDTLMELSSKKYLAMFCTGYAETVATIDNYLKKV